MKLLLAPDSLPATARAIRGWHGWRHRPVWFAVGAVMLLILIALAWPRTARAPVHAWHEAQRSDLLISVVEGGTIEAVNEVVIRSEVEGTARIIYLIPEGSYVKKGNLLVELDSAAAQDQVNQQQIAAERARFALVMAREQLAIQKIAGEGEVSAAQLRLELVETDRQRYLEGQSPQLRRNLENDIQAARENLLVAEERLTWSEKLYAKGYETKANLDRDRLTVSQYKAKLAQAEQALWIFDEFDFPKQKRQLESNVEHAQRDLGRIKLQNDRRLAQLEADITAQETTVDLSEKKLERDQAKLAACKIHAPQDGLVVYAGSGSRSSSESLIEEGATIRNRQEIIKLPDVSQMKLTVRVHEAYINMITLGLSAFVVLDARPDVRFRGTVSRVALLPDTQSRWINPNLKVYATEILITDPLPDVKPGVSARAEIVITNLINVLSVPLQAVTTQQGRPVVHVARGKTVAPVPVELGRYNTKSIHIVAGLNPGDRVSLAPPLMSDSRALALGIPDAPTPPDAPAAAPPEKKTNRPPARPGRAKERTTAPPAKP